MRVPQNCRTGSEEKNVNAEYRWAKISCVKEHGMAARVSIDGSDATALFECMASLVEGCAASTGLDVVGVLGRLTVILMEGVDRE